MRATAIAAIFVILASPPAFSQSQEYCSVALTERAYDRVSSSEQSRIVFAARDDICSREYNSIGEAQATARKRGFNLGAGGFSIGGGGAKQTSTNKWNISETTFCSASVTDLESVYESDFKSEIASTAVNAWLDCVKASTRNSLYLEYDISRDGQLFTGTFWTTANTGTLYRQITGIPVVGEGKETVRCNIAGKWYDPNEVVETPIQIEQTGTAIACEKTDDKGVRIAFQTSADSTPFIALPSKREIEASEWEKLEAAMATQKAALQAEIASANSNTLAVQNKLTTLNTRKWSSQTANRRFNVTYRNTLPHPISVSIVQDSPARNNKDNASNRCDVFIKVDGLLVARSRNNNHAANKACTVSATVPPNSTYIAHSVPHDYPAGTGLSAWHELR